MKIKHTNSPFFNFNELSQESQDSVALSALVLMEESIFTYYFAFAILQLVMDIEKDHTKENSIVCDITTFKCFLLEHTSYIFCTEMLAKRYKLPVMI